jgi:hypothetical protein
MNYNFTRNTIILGLLAVGVGLWGGNPSRINAAPNSSSGSSSGSISAEFEATGFDNPTFIDNLVIDNNYGIGMLSPLSNSNITFSITDVDSGALDNIALEVRFFFENDYMLNVDPIQLDGDGDGMDDETQYEGDVTLDAAYEAHDETTNDGDAFVLVQKDTPSSSDYFQVAYAPLLSSSDVTWSLGSNGYTESTYTRSFSISFQVSKVAKYTYDGNWTLGVRALNLAKTEILAEAFSTSYDMDWYGEIVTPATQVFINGESGSVAVGSEYINNTSTIENVLFISNGSFDQLIGTDSSWSSDKANPMGGNYEGYVASSSDVSMAQYFHLVASDTSQSTGFTTLPTVGNMSYAGTTVSTQDGTTEEGSQLDYYLYLKTSDNFQNANYSGIIYLGIQNSYLS